jgi:predicted GNAT family acetyltransferase
VTVQVRLLDDAGAFLIEAGEFLLEAEARHNLILGVAGTIRAEPSFYRERRFWVVTDGAEILAVALRTPPYNLIVARPRDPAALEALAAGIGDELPGVAGAQPEADEFARIWAGRHDLATRTDRGMGVYALERVEPVRPTAGAPRDASAEDLPLLLAWMAAFSDEALAENDPGRYEAEAIVEHRLAATDAGFRLWENNGVPVSVAGWGGPTPNGIRIGPVYTPPELRGRGYATALVAELSQALLDQGRSFCFLFTDLANPTSNAIYERIGYVRVCESAAISFL